ncbi:MAG TPA: hypothetical protein VGP83_17095 [Pyrinomonadaceae bacterium]|nr:hypothetical protein [Pyrinomonadaceae bacterium]
MTTYRIPISNGIFAHRKRIGAAIWVFLWLIDKTTKEVEAVDGESMDGLVFGGRPVTMSAVAGDLQMSINGVRDQLSQLLKGGYIRAIQHGAGIANGYAVLNSKKWGRSGTHEEESEAVVDPTGKLEGSTGKVEGPPIGKVEGVHRKTVGGPPENSHSIIGKTIQTIQNNPIQPTES